MSGLTLDPDPPAVQLDEALREREAEAGAVTLLHTDVGLLELLEDPLLVAGCDAGPRVGNRHVHLTVEACGRHGNASARGRELDRIREDVEHDLAKAPLVAADAVDIRRKLERELDAVPDRLFGHHHDAALERLVQ